MIVRRVEKHKIKKNHNFYPMLDSFCFLSKNLYNHANYIIRQEFCKNNKWIRHQDIDKLLKADVEFPDYRNMPSAQSAQQLLRQLDKNWVSFFKSIKDWSNNPTKYLGKPKLPKYKAKKGRCMLTLTNQDIKVKSDNQIHFPKTFKGFTLKPKCIYKENFIKIQQIRFIPKSNHIVAEIVYNIEISDNLNDSNKYLSIDIGLDNLATVVNNFGEKPFIINGKGLKSVNQYWNKKKAHYQKCAQQLNNQKSTNRLKAITDKRNYIIDNYMHQASRIIVNYAIRHNVSTIVIGNNKNWKQKIKLSKKVNQSFIQIPFSRLIEMIEYKAQEVGIQVVLTEESYTSGTSFLDNEKSIKSNYNKSRRIHRGLFLSNKDVKIDADVNGAYQIMKKVFPKEYSNGIEGVVLHPIVVNACYI